MTDDNAGKRPAGKDASHIFDAPDKCATVLAALDSWKGRQGPIPHRAEHWFNRTPPLTSEQIATLMARFERRLHELHCGGISPD